MSIRAESLAPNLDGGIVFGKFGYRIRVSEFNGIVIHMYPLNHFPPHFHAQYAEYEATYDIESGTLIVGEMPRRQTKQIVDWVQRHQAQLMANWERIRAGEYPESINEE